MKITLPKNYRSYFTLDDLEAAKSVIQFEKEYDEDSAAGWGEYAAREALKGTDDYLAEVIQAKAEIAKNNRIYNAYNDTSGYMDVWIDGIARTKNGFIEFGAYLTDIWQTGAIDYKQHMFIVRYKREEE